MGHYNNERRYYDNERRNDRELDTIVNGTLIITMILLVIWIIIGIAAFFTSIFCFFRKGTSVDKIVGLVLAIFFGPFYFLFYAFKSDYCVKNI
jgi:hypothetical protein